MGAERQTELTLTAKQETQLTGILKKGLKLMEKAAAIETQLDGLRREAASLMDDSSFIMPRVGRITRAPNSRTTVKRDRLVTALSQSALKFFLRPAYTKETLDNALSQGIIDATLYGRVVVVKQDEKHPWKVTFVPDQG